jgi:hypothetical protein
MRGYNDSRGSTTVADTQAMHAHPAQTAASRRGNRRRFVIGLVLVLVAVTAVYAPTINDYFGGDDFLVIGPVKVMDPWELIGRSIIMRDNIPYWRPLVSPLYALEVHGFWLRPWAYHLVALALHLTNVVLLMLIARTLTGSRSVAVTAGLLFGIHPAHTTTVAQISSTVELLSVVCYFSTVLCAVRYVRDLTPLPPSLNGRGSATRDSAVRPKLVAKKEPGTPAEQPTSRAGLPLPLREGGRGGRSHMYLLSLLAFVLALLAKESTASAAGVVTVLFFCYGYLPERRLRRFVRDVAPFWALVLPYIALTYITDTDDPTGIIQHMYFLGGHVGQNMWWFLSRLALPLDVGQGPHVSAAGHVGAAVLLAAAVALLVRGTSQSRFLVLWTGIALTPLALWRPDLLLGRFTYQASAPFAILLALGGAWLVARVRRRLGSGAPGWAPGLALLAIAVVVLGGLTMNQNRDRTREGEDYRVLVAALRRDYPSLPPGSQVALVDGIWSGPFHALYLGAVADTLYGAGNVRIVNVDPGEPAPDTVVARLRYDGVELRAAQ